MRSRGPAGGGVGIIAIDASERNGDVVDLDLVDESDQIMVITDRGQIIRTSVREVRQASRNTLGVRIIKMDEGEHVVGVEPLAEPEVEGGESIPPPAPTGEEGDGSDA